jgi:protein-disulfide isomerase
MITRETPRTAERTRRRRLSILGAALAVALAAIVVAALASGSSSQAAPSVADTFARSTVVDGIPEHNGVLGDPKAPVTVTEYVDLQCPICAQASLADLPPLIDQYVKTGKVKLRMRTLSFLGPDSVEAARVAHGAEQQGRLWSFVETFYANQGSENTGYVTDAFLQRVATAAGVNYAAARTYSGTDPAQQALTKANRAAQAIGVDATPTFTITKANGKEHILQVGAGDVATTVEKAS